MILSLGVKTLIVTVCILLSVIVAMVAGWLSHTSGQPMKLAILYGGGAFTACLLLCLRVLSSLGVL
ncbi:hypothetical protein ABZ137_07785 [Streptomyces bobili]|uniref:hypothetical protein n=1 Tax=Streptomyces bobili TaxID=67280 RepID=UPI0033AC4944